MIGFIGGGNMAEALIKGMTAKGMKDIFVSEPREERCAELQRAYGIKTTASNKEVAASCGIIILAVKPQNMEDVLREISGEITERQMVVSIAAISASSFSNFACSSVVIALVSAFAVASTACSTMVRVMP